MRKTILATMVLLASSLTAGTLPALLGSAPLGSARADSGPLRDPTGCATGSAVANCRSLPPMRGDSSSGSSLRGSGQRDSDQKKGSSSHQRMKTSPLPSEFLPPGSTGLDKGSTGISKQPLLLPKSRINH